MPRLRRLEHPRRDRRPRRRPAAERGTVASPRPGRPADADALAAIAEADRPAAPPRDRRAGSRPRRRARRRGRSSWSAASRGSASPRSCSRPLPAWPAIRRPAAVLYATGEESAAQVRLRAARLGLLDGGLGGTASGSSPSTTSGGSSRRPGPSAPALRRRRFDPDRDGRRARRARRQRRAGPRGDAPADGPREGRGDRGHPRRPRHQGRLDRRPEDPRAPRRRRAEPRGRAVRVAAPACARPRTGSGRPTRSASSRWRERGLREVADPARAFLADHDEPAPGSVVAPTLEGSRPLLVEVQALVAAARLRLADPAGQRPRSEPPQPAARRPGPAGRASGSPDHDVYANLAGGLTVVEPGPRPAAGPRPRLVAPRSAGLDRPRSPSARSASSASCAPSRAWTGGSARPPGSGFSRAIVPRSAPRSPAGRSGRDRGRRGRDARRRDPGRARCRLAGAWRARAGDARLTPRPDRFEVR